MQESALIDRFGRRHTYLRISVTDRCNFRCVYCMPEEGVEWKERESILTYEEILRVSRVFRSLGIDKVRLTGGEPTVRKGIETLIGGLSELGFAQVLMTTNGTTLRHRAADYRNVGLTGINVSLDTLRHDRFLSIARRDGLQTVLEGIESAIGAGFDPVKVNVVVMKGMNDDELADFVAYFADRPVQIRFIEFMPFAGNRWSEGGLVPYREMRRQIEDAYDLVPLTTEPTAVAKEFAVKGCRATVGFVTSMTESFCEGCNRIRLTADGQIKACLFSAHELPLKDLLRSGASDDEIERVIREAIYAKQSGHAPAHILAKVKNRSMIQIGG